MASCRNVDIGKVQVVDNSTRGRSEERFRQSTDGVVVALDDTSKGFNSGSVTAGINVIINKEVLVVMSGEFTEIVGTIDAIAFAGDGTHRARWFKTVINSNGTENRDTCEGIIRARCLVGSNGDFVRLGRHRLVTISGIIIVNRCPRMIGNGNDHICTINEELWFFTMLLSISEGKLVRSTETDESFGADDGAEGKVVQAACDVGRTLKCRLSIISGIMDVGHRGFASERKQVSTILAIGRSCGSTR